MKKLLLTITISALLLSSGMYVHAADQVIEEEGTASVEIVVDISSTFEVNIPDLVEITKREVKEFEITGTGNIASTEYLELTMPDTVTMSTTGKEDMDLELSIDKTQFTSEELAADGGIVANCSVDASDISSGVWTGNAEVTVELKDTLEVNP